MIATQYCSFADHNKNLVDWLGNFPIYTFGVSILLRLNVPLLVCQVSTIRTQKTHTHPNTSTDLQSNL